MSLHVFNISQFVMEHEETKAAFLIEELYPWFYSFDQHLFH